MKTTLTRTLTCSTMVGLIALTSLAGCDKKNTNSIPSDAKGRLTAMAAHLPASTEAALFVGDVAKMRNTVNDINVLGEALPELGATQKQVEAELGFDPLDANSWKQAGIPDGSAITVAFVNNRAVIMTYVEDRQKFDTMLSDKLKKALDSTEAPKTQDVNGKQVKLMGADKEQIAWLHDGKLAIIATSVLDEQFTFGNQGAAADFVATLTTTKEAESAAKAPQFTQFMKGITPDYSLAAYANVQAILKNDAFKKELEKNQDPSTRDVMKRLEKEAQVVGLGLHQKDNSFKITAFYGADDATNKRLAAIGKPTGDSPFEAFASDGMLLGLRTSLDTQKMWAYYMETLPAEQKTEILNGLKQAGQASQLDIEKDIINNLTGHVGIFLYGLNAGAIMGAMGNPEKAVQSLNLAFAVEFKEDAQVNKLVDKLKAALQAEPVDQGGVKVMALPQNMGTIYVKGKMLVFGANELKQADAVNMLGGKSTKGTLKGELGKSFATDKAYGGLYLNVDKLSAIVSLLAGNSPVSDVLGKIGEVALTTDAVESGSALNLRFTLKSTGAKEKK